MGMLEAAIAIAASLLIVGAPRSLASGITLKLLLALSIGGVLLVLLVGPSRWQLVPLTLLAILGGGLGLRRLRHGYRQRRIWVRGLVVTGCTLLLIITAAPLVLFPPFDLPQPSGPRPVGVADLHIRDQSRPDPLRGGKREFMIRAWYPADSGPSRIAPYVTQTFANDQLFGPQKNLVLHHLPSVRTSGRLGLKPAGTAIPVLIFLPGYASYNAQSTTLAQDLASNGYVVLSIGSPGDAAGVEFPGGRVAEFRRYAFLDQLGRATSKLLSQILDDPSPERMAALARELRRIVPAAKDALHLISGDAESVMDRIDRGGLGLLDGHLDPSRIGIVGMSFGGAVAGQVCSQDPRCRAGINLDGYQFSDLQGREIGRPFLMVANGAYKRSYLNDTFGRAPVRPADAAPLLNIQVSGSRHLDFTDLTLLSPVAKRYLKNEVVGPISGPRMIGLTSALVQGFFDEFVLGRTRAFDDAIARWPEVKHRRPPLPPGWAE